MAGSDAQQAVEAVFRIESAKLIAGLTRLTRDVGQAEELAQEAMLHALEQWPRQGIPDNPGAWLMQAAKHRGIDAMRRRSLHAHKEAEISRDADQRHSALAPDLDAKLDDDVGDDLLRLVFIACHPVLATEARVALTLRLLGGLTTDEIARAFLVPEPTVAQRIVRAKKTLADKQVPFELPRREALHERMESVLEVIYLVFNEGYAATKGDDWLRPSLIQDALRLGRILQGLLPDEPEVHGLVALMELQASRSAARVGKNGEPILLLEQDRAKWDQTLIRHGLSALERAESLAGQRGPYTMQAALAACHARARTADQTDWKRIAALYAELSEMSPSPVVEINRAVAVGFAEGPAAGLAVIDAVANDKALAGYPMLPGVRGDLLAKLGRFDEAKAEFERAAQLTHNERERSVLLGRATKAASGQS